MSNIVLSLSTCVLCYCFFPVKKFLLGGLSAPMYNLRKGLFCNHMCRYWMGQRVCEESYPTVGVLSPTHALEDSFV